MTRLYLPSSLPRLAERLGRGEPETDLSEVVVAEDDSEEGEYAALMTAADVSAVLVAGLPDGVRRRVVVVGEASTTAPLRLRDVVAVHVDPVDDAEPDDDLAWFATQELPHLLR